MKVLDLVLAKVFLKAFGVLLYILIAVNVVHKALRYFSSGMSIWGFSEYALWSSVDKILVSWFSFMLLFSLLQVRNYLHAENRLNSLLSCGVSPYRMALPVIILLGSMCFLNWKAKDTFIPGSLEKANYAYYVKVKKRKDYRTLQLSHFWHRNNNDFVYIENYDFQDQKAYSVKVFKIDNKWELQQATHSSKASVENSKVWKLDNSLNYIQSGVPVNPKVEIKDTYTFDKDVELFEKSAVDFDFMSFSEIEEFLGARQKVDLTLKPYEYNFARKHADSVSAFLLACLLLFTMLFPKMRHKGKKQEGFFLAIGALLLEITLVILFEFFYNSSSWANATFLAWGPSVVLGFCCIYMLYRFKKLRIQRLSLL